MYLVPVWALFSSVRSRMGWALVSSRVSPSGLSGALLPWSSSFWRCQITRICGPPLSPCPLRRYWIVPSHQIQSPVWSLRKGCWTFAPFSNPGTLWAGPVLVAGGRMMRMPGRSGAVVVVGGRMTRMLGLGSSGGSGGMWGVGRLLLFRLGWGRVRPFVVSFAWVGLEVAGLGGHGVWKKGCVACWSGSLSGGSAGVCIFAFAWLRTMSASLRTVSGGSVGHGSAAGLSSKGWCRW